MNTEQSKVVTIESFNKTNVVKAINELIIQNANLFASNAKRESFSVLINDLLAPSRVRNDNPYLYDEQGNVTDIKCAKYGIYLPLENFPTPSDGKYKTTSKIASWKYNELEKQIKEIEADTMAKIFSGIAVDTNDIKARIDTIKQLQKTDYTDFEADKLTWLNREGKRGVK